MVEIGTLLPSLRYSIINFAPFQALTGSGRDTLFSIEMYGRMNFTVNKLSMEITLLHPKSY